MTSPTPYGATPNAVARRTNVFAIVSLVLSIIGFTVVGIVFGFIALSQIKKNGDGGRGLAIAGIVIGFIELILGVILIIVFAVIAANSTVVTTY
ncbi:MAG: hypothetical protein JWQ64_3364 [Subtercola sp.]|jgi:hypothetical protein|nr:hypothetical protein [Subtercola sp.]